MVRPRAGVFDVWIARYALPAVVSAHRCWIDIPRSGGLRCVVCHRRPRLRCGLPVGLLPVWAACQTMQKNGRANARITRHATTLLSGAGGSPCGESDTGGLRQGVAKLYRQRGAATLNSGFRLAFLVCGSSVVPLRQSRVCACGAAKVRNWNLPLSLKSQSSNNSRWPARSSSFAGGCGSGAARRSVASAVLSASSSPFVR